MKIAILVSFLAVLIVFFVVAQIPVTLTSDEIDRAVTEAATPGLPVDEEVLARALMISVEKIEKGQRTRLKYLASAYLVIWLVFVLYVLRLERQQQELDKRLDQLEQESDDP